jgi:hypothetical protein
MGRICMPERILKIMQKGYTIDVAVNIQKQNLINLQKELTTQTGGIGGLHGGAIGDDVGYADGKASGGMLSSGWNLVGDKPGGVFVPGVSELIKDGRVYNSADSAQLINSGKVGGVKSYAQAGEDYGSNSVTFGKTPGGLATTTVKGFDPKRALFSSGGGGGASSSAVLSSAAESISASVNQSQSIAQQLAMISENNAQRIERSNAVMASKMDVLIGVMMSENPRAIGKQVSYELAKVF